MKNFIRRLVLFFAMAGGVAQHVGAAPIDELDRFAGTWKSQGTFVDGPYSKASSSTATSACAWSVGRTFMICQQSISSEGKTTYDLGIYTYDQDSSAYRFYNIQPGQTSSSAITVSGNTITYPFSFTDKGKKVETRTLNIWENATLYRWRAEYSIDGGASWNLMGSGSSQRQ